MFWSRLQLRNGDVTAFERERVIRLLERVGLGDQLHKRPGTMSGGRISVVRLSAPSQTSQRSFSLMSPQEILTAVREAKSSK
jgi:predicted ABC-type transport system involved in lysophospholipase L1 biosynthesis ATPase subunit